MTICYAILQDLKNENIVLIVLETRVEISFVAPRSLVPVGMNIKKSTYVIIWINMRYGVYFQS